MDPEHKDLLRRKYVYLFENLDVECVLEAFREESLLSHIALDRIRHETLRWDRVRNFLDYLPRLGPRAFGVFLKAVQCHQPEVYTELTGEVVIVPRENDKNVLLHSDTCVNLIAVITKRKWSRAVEIVCEIEKHCPESKVLLLSVEDLHKAIYFNAVVRSVKNNTLFMPILCENFACHYRNQVKVYSVALKSGNIHAESNLRPVYLDNVRNLELFQQHGE